MDIDTIRLVIGAVLIAIGVPLFTLARYLLAPEEKKKRMENMRKVVSENNVYRWAGNIITELTALKKV